METLRLILLFAHLVGMAAILGGFLAQLRDRRIVVPVMVRGAVAQLITGIALVATREAQELTNDQAKIAAKLGVAITVLVVAWLGKRQGRSSALFYATGLLTAANVAVAVFWT